MKKSLLALLLVIGVVAATMTSPVAAKASYCSDSPYDTNYRKTYEYPTGTYWQKQIKANPKYYQANNAYYLEKYGC